MAQRDSTLRETDIVISYSRGTRSGTVRLSRWTGLAMFGALPTFAAWIILSGVYLAYHDPLLGALMARQASMEEAYENRIEMLTSSLDHEMSRGTVDRQALGLTLGNLAALGMRLEERTGALELLTLRVSKASGSPRCASLADIERPALPERADPPARTVPAGPALRLGGADQTGDASASSTRVKRQSAVLDEAEALRRTSVLSRSFAGLERRQVRTVIGLGEPVLRHISRLQGALAQAGLPLPPSPRNAGGPFIPLAAEAADFDAMAAVLRASIAQGEHLRLVIDETPLRRPIEGPLEVTSTFGARLDPFLGRPAMHTGIDLLESAGDRVLSTAGGTVTLSGADGGYGNMVEITHGNGIATRYAHLASINVVLHQKVAAGTLVGRIGSTGRATGPHLHYETRVNGVPVDPARFLKAGFGLSPDD